MILMINQLKSIVGFKEEEVSIEAPTAGDSESKAIEGEDVDTELLKTRIDSLGLSSRTTKALSNANIRTLGGLARKKESDIMDVDGLGAKGMQEIKKLLAQHGITLKQ